MNFYEVGFLSPGSWSIVGTLARRFIGLNARGKGVIK